MEKIIDVHVEVGYGSEVPFHVEDTLRAMERNGIAKGIISPILTYPLPQGISSSREQNDNIAACLRKYPDRFVAGLGAVDPRNGPKAAEEVHRCFGELGLAGLAFDNSFSGRIVDHADMFKLMEAVNRYSGKIVLLNTAPYAVLNQPFKLGRLAEAFPDITFINGYALSCMTHVGSSKDMASKHPNVYIDIARCIWIHNSLGGTIEFLGADRILFGSDIPFYTNCLERPVLEGTRNNMNLSDEVMEKIYYKNAAKLFGLNI